MKQNAWKPQTIKESQNYFLIEDQGYLPDLNATYANTNWGDSSISSNIFEQEQKCDAWKCLTNYKRNHVKRAHIITHSISSLKTKLLSIC